MGQEHASFGRLQGSAGVAAMIPLSQLLQEQYNQQIEVMGPAPLDRTASREWAQKFGLYLIDEVLDYLHAISYKHFLPVDEAPRQTRVYEITDMLKYVLCLAWLENITGPELETSFQNKTATVYERFKSEKMKRKVCGFDIDGVLTKPEGYRSDMSEEEKEAFFESGMARKVQPADGAVELLQSLKEEGWSIVLVTSRKVWRHAILETETYQWLHEHNIPFDKVLWGYDKGEAIGKSGLKFAFFVEDAVKHAVDLADNGLKVFLIGHPEIAHKGIQNVSELREIRAAL